MPINDIPILSMLRERMQWQQARQQVLAENVANADTPDYQAKDLAPLDFSQQLTAALPLERTNPNGGAIALGHPLGATGAVLMTKLVYELERSGGRFGLQTMCEGGGQANATIIERV